VASRPGCGPTRSPTRPRPPVPGTCPSTATRSSRRRSGPNDRASATFDEGTEARETADRYVRVTVLFALVLFLVAVGQRFRVRGVHLGAMALALGMLVYGLYTVSTLPWL
jgi:hypothetical protein